MRVMLDTNISVLYIAVIEGIDVLITGDKDFHHVEIEKPVIMTVVEFEKEYMKT